MHEKRKKYYHIRKDLFWCTILLAVSFLIGYAIHQHHGIFLTHSMKADAPKERIEITFDDLQSSLKDLSTCYLCGSSDYSMMDYYRKFDTVGLPGATDKRLHQARESKACGEPKIRRPFSWNETVFPVSGAAEIGRAHV